MKHSVIFWLEAERGFAAWIVVGIIALLGVGGWGLSKTKLFHGESKRAETSTQTTENLIKATDNQGAAAAAYVATIGATNSGAPESKEKQAIAGLVPVALSFLPAPDPNKLLEAEKLKNAYLSGQLSLANSLTASAISEAATARKETLKAISAKRASDLALEEAAAEARGAEQQAFWLMLIAGAIAILYIWTKLSHVSPLALSAAVKDMRSGTGEPNPAIAAIDSVTSPFQQANVALMHWLRTKLDKLKS